MFQMVGTIRSAVQMAQMESQWQKKQQELGEKKDKRDKRKELTVEEKQLQKYEEDLEKMRESNKRADISNKLMAGGVLTASEIEYLKKNAPELLKEYQEIEQDKKAYKKQLKGCESKEDVEKLKTTKMGEFMAQAKKIANNPNIPESKKIGLLQKIIKKAAGIQEEHLKFTKTLQYKNLPEKKEYKKEHQVEDISKPTEDIMVEDKSLKKGEQEDELSMQEEKGELDSTELSPQIEKQEQIEKNKNTWGIR